MRRRLIVLIGMTIGEVCALASAASAKTSYPMIMRVEPVVMTRGQSVELTISGCEKFDGAFGLICQQPGLRGEILMVEANERPETKARQGQRRQATPQVKARLDVAADAPLGPREVRVATPQGVSTVGLVVVGDEPVILEADDQANDRPANAQRLTLPSAVSGRISRVEDIDWYVFEAEPGEWIAFEIWANRLENKIHDLQTHFDPILTVCDARSRQIAVADNTYSADPLLAFRAPARGRYYLEVRDTTYAGNASWCYGLRDQGTGRDLGLPHGGPARHLARVELSGP